MFVCIADAFSFVTWRCSCSKVRFGSYITTRSDSFRRDAVETSRVVTEMLQVSWNPTWTLCSCATGVGCRDVGSCGSRAGSWSPACHRQLAGLIKVSNDLQPSQQINTSESLHYRCPPVCLSEHLDPRCYLLQWLLAASLCKLAGPLEQQILAPSCAARDYCPLLFLCGLWLVAWNSAPFLR